MPLEKNQLLDYLKNNSDTRFHDELITLLLKRIEDLCFNHCQIDRIQCTLSPMCRQRHLLKLRIINGLSIGELPQFCYSVHKSVITRDLRNKTVVYKPFDAYLYLIDFLDIFFHGDYRRLNKFISFKQWDDVRKIFNKRINKGEPFNYFISENHILIKYEDKIHVMFIDEKIVLCNALRENIFDIEVLKGFCDLYAQLYFPEAELRIRQSGRLRISTKIPAEVITKITDHYEKGQEQPKKADHYFWEVFWDDLDGLLDTCDGIQIRFRRNNEMVISLFIDLLTNKRDKEGKQVPLKFKDVRLILNFVYKMYNEFYVVWVKRPEGLIEI